MALAVVLAGLPVMAHAQSTSAPAGYPSTAVVQPLPDPNDPEVILANNLKILAQNPYNVDALLAAGQGATNAGDPNAAIGFLARAEELSPRNGRVKAALGSALIMIEKPAEALRMFGEATALGVPEHAVAKDRGLAWDLRGDTARAQADYTLALAGYRDDEITRRYALSLGSSGKKDAALKLLDPLTRKGDQAAWRAKAFIYAMNGESAEAERIVRAVMAPNMVGVMTPFLQQLPRLTLAQRAQAVNFGTMPAVAGARPVVDPGESFRSVGNGQTAGLASPVEARPAPVAQVAESARDRKAREKREKELAKLAARQKRESGSRVAVAPKPIVVPPPVKVAVATPQPERPLLAPSPLVTPKPIVQPAPQPVAPKVEPVKVEPVKVAVAEPTPKPITPLVVEPKPMVSAPKVEALPPSKPEVAAQSPFTIPPSPVTTPVTTTPPAAKITPPVVTAEAPKVEASPIITKPVEPLPVPVTTPPVTTPPVVATVTPTPVVTTPASVSVTPTVETPPAAKPLPFEIPKPVPIEPAPVEATPVVPLENPAPATPVQSEPVAPAAEPTAAPVAEGLGAVLAEIPVEAESSAGPLPTDAEFRQRQLEAKRKEEARKKAEADAKAKADAAEKLKLAKEAEAKKEAEEKAADLKRNPSRIWVQIATGSNRTALGYDWKRLKGKAPNALAGQSAWVAPNRLLIGPFKSQAEARAKVNALSKEGLATNTHTSEAGQEVTRLGGK